MYLKGNNQSINQSRPNRLWLLWSNKAAGEQNKGTECVWQNSQDECRRCQHVVWIPDRKKNYRCNCDSWL